MSARTGTLNNAFFVNLLEMGVTWSAIEGSDHEYAGRTADGDVKWKASSVDLLFGIPTPPIPATPSRVLRTETIL